MIPILYPSTETSFSDHGLGPLSDTISCTVTEERNGSFELVMTYPLDGNHYSDISDRCIIMAIPSPYRTAQPFRIYQIEAPLNGIVTIHARHVAYDLSGMPLEPFSTTGNAQTIMNAFASHAPQGSTAPFTFSSDITGSADLDVEIPSSIRQVLGGQEGSLLDLFHGEFLWDRFNCSLLSARGTNSGVRIAYGKNMTDFLMTRDMTVLATGVYPFWKSDSDYVEITGKILRVLSTNYEYIIPLDMSSEFDTQPTSIELYQAEQTYVSEHNLTVPQVTFDVSFVDLASTDEYDGISDLEQVDLCDTVTVSFPAYEVTATAKVVGIETNVLTERYNKVTVGTVRANIADTIAGLETSGTTSSGGGGGTSFSFPVGSVVITDTNTNPGTDLGGTWSLIDKEFKSQSRTATVTRNTTNLSALSVTALYEGHNITFIGSMTTRVSMSNTNLEMLTQTLTNNGASALPSALPFTGYCDSAHAICLMDIGTDGRVRTLDVVVRGNSTSVSSGNTFEWTVTCPCLYTSMVDSFCNKFYWERTA